MPETTEPKIPDPRRFYVVWCPQGGPPVVRFPNFGAARTCWGRIGTPAVAVEATAPDTPGSEATP
jgi:hypothetical protein